jgi:hypothetical protein
MHKEDTVFSSQMNDIATWEIASFAIFQPPVQILRHVKAIYTSNVRRIPEVVIFILSSLQAIGSVLIPGVLQPLPAR